MFAPRLYHHYAERLEKVWDSNHSLRPGFDNSIWPCVAVNFGTCVVTRSHHNCMNVAYGWCAIMALGRFNSLKGGHLVLSDLKMIIRFPLGSTIFIPSAILTHCNIAIGKDEERVSFMQFCAGDIFRYVDCGLQTENQLKIEDPVLYRIHQIRKQNQWRQGLDLLPKGNPVPSC
jgi:hypothetical protein